MRIIAKRTLREFWERHPDAQSALLAWYQTTQRANWDTPAVVVARHPNASIVGNDRVVFRIKGNTYRLVALVNYRKGRVFIRFIGTHSEYDRINAAEV